MHNSKNNCHYFEGAQIECPVIFIRKFHSISFIESMCNYRVGISTKSNHDFEGAQIECPVIFIRKFHSISFIENLCNYRVGIFTKSNHDHIPLLDQLPYTCILKCVKSHFLLCNNIDNKITKSEII